MSRVTDRLAVADLDAEPGVAHVNAPFSANPIIKALDVDTRRWDDSAHVWIVEAEALPQLAAALLSAGFLVDIWHGGDVTMLCLQHRKATTR